MTEPAGGDERKPELTWPGAAILNRLHLLKEIALVSHGCKGKSWQEKEWFGGRALKEKKEFLISSPYPDSLEPVPSLSPVPSTSWSLQPTQVGVERILCGLLLTVAWCPVPICGPSPPIMSTTNGTPSLFHTHKVDGWTWLGFL